MININAIDRKLVYYVLALFTILGIIIGGYQITAHLTNTSVNLRSARDIQCDELSDNLRPQTPYFNEIVVCLESSNGFKIGKLSVLSELIITENEDGSSSYTNTLTISFTTINQSSLGRGDLFYLDMLSFIFIHPLVHAYSNGSENSLVSGGLRYVDGHDPSITSQKISIISVEIFDLKEPPYNYSSIEIVNNLKPISIRINNRQRGFDSLALNSETERLILNSFRFINGSYQQNEFSSIIINLDIKWNKLENPFFFLNFTTGRWLAIYFMTILFFSYVIFSLSFTYLYDNNEYELLFRFVFGIAFSNLLILISNIYLLHIIISSSLAASLFFNSAIIILGFAATIPWLKKIIFYALGTKNIGFSEVDEKKLPILIKRALELIDYTKFKIILLLPFIIASVRNGIKIEDILISFPF